MKNLVVIAVGGNSLIMDDRHQSIADQYSCVAATVRHIATIIEKGYRVVITHGNGPQVGFILLRSELARSKIHTVPLDSCVADTQGAIGYNFQMALYNELRRRGLKLPVATVVTQVVVDRHDEAFKNPSKPIGLFYPKKEADERMLRDGWEMMEDAGRGWRRVVASPAPKEIIELNAIKSLLDGGTIVIAVGGGGIPVVKDTRGNLHGVEAVIDKDYASALLARDLGADIFLISTAVEKAFLNFGKPNQKPLDKVSLRELKLYIKGGHFKKGSMLPKINAIISFLEKGGRKAIITDPHHIDLAIGSRAGTQIIR
ncbi:MAG: carbamate kinase [Deltaproteobacteria bacterium CG11_big_fil_rev_8_21_14_0_20_49_13]|nr:MAG: carbamate kinase [Deltaproteobacteria bacterium CG11_big_fil_rev_8_21_14_0_20_49_13]